MKSFTLPESMRINGLADTKELLTPLLQAEDDLELDGSAVGSIDTAGFQLLIAAQREVEKHGKTMLLKNPSEAIHKAITICNAESVINTA